jgi:phosphoglycerate dehydrogenase-like enzyme
VCASRPIHVLVTFPLAIDGAEMDTLRAIDPAIEIVGVPYVEEQAWLGRLLMIWKRFPEQAELQAARTWSTTYGRLVAESTIGIIGLGAIGAAVARLGDAFETEPLPADDPLWTAPNCHVSAHSSVSLDRYVQDGLFGENLRRVAGKPLANVVEPPA